MKCQWNYLWQCDQNQTVLSQPQRLQLLSAIKAQWRILHFSHSYLTRGNLFDFQIINKSIKMVGDCAFFFSPNKRWRERKKKKMEIFKVKKAKNYFFYLNIRKNSDIQLLLQGSVDLRKSKAKKINQINIM